MHKQWTSVYGLCSARTAYIPNERRLEERAVLSGERCRYFIPRDGIRHRLGLVVVAHGGQIPPARVAADFDHACHVVRQAGSVSQQALLAPKCARAEQRTCARCSLASDSLSLSIPNPSQFPLPCAPSPSL